MGRRKKWVTREQEAPRAERPSAQQLAPVVQPFHWDGYIGATGLSIGAFGVMPFYFWCGVALAYIGLLLAAASVFVDRWFTGRPFIRISALCVVLLTTVIFSRLLVFAPAPAVIQCRFISGDYPPGTVIAGIPWELGLAELQVVFSNRSDYDISDVSLILNSDFVNVAVGQLSALPGVSFGPYMMSRPMAKLQDKTGRRWDVPIKRNGGIWVVRCDKVPPQTGVTVVMALSDPANPNGEIAKRKPGWVSIHGGYKAMMRTRSFQEEVTAF